MKSNVRKFGIGLMFFVLFLLCVGTEKSIASTMQTQAEINAPAEVDITFLLHEYKDNKFAADINYGDKVIKISGTISDIDKTSNGGAMVIVTKDDSKVYCHFDKNETAPVLNLRKGQQIKIDGICKFDTVLDMLEMHKCSIPKAWTYGTGHEAMISSIYDVAQSLVKGTSPQFQASATMEAFEGSTDLHLRLWTAEHYAVLINYENETWEKGYIVGFWTDDPSLTFANGLKVGSYLGDIKTFYNYQGEDDGTLYSSDDGAEWHSYLARSTVAFAIKDWYVQTIRFVSLTTDIPPEIKQAITGTILKAEKKANIQPATGDKAEKNLSAFVESINKNANNISWASPHTYQDTEEQADEWGDSWTIRMRAWAGDYYFLIRSYSDKTWSSSTVTNFWTNSEELEFSGGIKIGSHINDVYAFLGNDGILDSAQQKYSIRNDDFAVDFRLANGYVTEITYQMLFDDSITILTGKIPTLFALYSSMMNAEITGEKVNVRNAPSTNGKILFQVSNSKKDCLIVSKEEASNWYRVHYQLIYQGNSSYQVKPIKQSAYIIENFIRLSPLSKETRKFLERF